MIKKVSNIKGFVVGMLFISGSLLAQTEPDSIALVNDEFQESYYESLKQKGIENYDKAIIALENCLKLQPENAVIHHELGKNYFFQKDYQNAEIAFIKASQYDPKNKMYSIEVN